MDLLVTKVKDAVYVLLQCILRVEAAIKADLANKKPPEKIKSAVVFVIKVWLRIFSWTLVLCLTMALVVFATKATKDDITESSEK